LQFRRNRDNRDETICLNNNDSKSQKKKDKTEKSESEISNNKDEKNKGIKQFNTATVRKQSNFSNLTFEDASKILKCKDMQPVKTMPSIFCHEEKRKNIERYLIFILIFEGFT
jgi:uncharacterized membrane protein